MRTRSAPSAPRRPTPQRPPRQPRTASPQRLREPPTGSTRGLMMESKGRRARRALLAPATCSRVRTPTAQARSTRGSSHHSWGSWSSRCRLGKCRRCLPASTLMPPARLRSTSLSRVSLHSQRSLSDWLELNESCADFEKKKAATMSKPSATLRRTAALKDLDYTTRWLFPIVFVQ